MRKRYKFGLTVIVIILIIICSIGINKYLTKDPEEEPKNTTKVVNDIKEYGYTLDDRDTKYMQEEFNNLHEILNAEEINYEDYAQSIAKLFIIDFYTLNNKINKYDVGGLEYVYLPKKEEFNSKAMDTIYKDIIDNTYQDRVQDLPEITNVEVLDVKENEIEVNKTKMSGYKVTMRYIYKENLGYDTKGTCYLVLNNEKLEVAKYNPNIDN